MDHSPLKKLPAELRNQIAELVLHHEGDFQITHEDCKHFKLRPNSNHPAHPHGLASTCKQLHHECMQLFYSLNEFKVGCKDGRVVGPAAAFLRQVGSSNAEVCSLVMLRDLGICALDSPEPTYSRESAHPDHFRYAFESVMLNIRENEAWEEVVAGCGSVHLEFKANPYEFGGVAFRLDAEDLVESLYRAFDHIHEVPIHDPEGRLNRLLQFFWFSVARLQYQWAEKLEREKD
ncbi:hypothetical protein DOTSEDRAFT_71643 [Dothistroma septosporum NZE10]|uniref:Uncharacterized protein n=1 Tax=Dothistroma septosporum (strain NZE10 / CBS 128990) TaxID=675120 RepID=N1PNA8_DOTSN|nr:hypothetical protein DOTSEDRAFT_71643 [Dothistroma septosporum NZE10]